MDSPRSVFHAQRLGWTVVQMPRQSFTWSDVILHIKRSITGQEVHHYVGTTRIRCKICNSKI